MISAFVIEAVKQPSNVMLVFCNELEYTFSEVILALCIDTFVMFAFVNEAVKHPSKVTLAF